MGQPVEPVPGHMRASTPPTPDQTTIDASHTEIVVLAAGILFLVVQLMLVIWFCVPRTFSRKPSEQRTIAWQSGSTILHSNEEHEDRPARRRRTQQRRSSTWNGRAAVATGQDGNSMRRRKSSGIARSVGPRSAVFSPSSEADSDSSGHDMSVREGIQNVGLATASLAISMVPLSSRPFRSLLSSPEPESDDSNEDFAREMHPMLPSVGLDAIFSPRSPRLGHIDQATIEILQEERRKLQTLPPASQPVAGPVDEEKGIADGFDDPLGVNRRRALFGSEKRDSGESPGRPDQDSLSSESALSTDGQPWKERPSNR